MAGINQSTPAPVVQGQVYPSAPPLPAYYPGAGATSPAAASPPFYTQGTGGPYRQPSVVIVPGPSSGYSVEPGVKGNVGGPGPTVVYQPVATGMGQPAVVMYASSPELPVSPHPAIALVLGIIAIICCCNCVCGIPAIVLGAIVLAKHPRDPVQQKTAITMSKVGLGLGIAALVFGALFGVLWGVLQYIGRGAAYSN